MGLRLKEQQSLAALCTKTLRAAGLLPLAGVGSVVTAVGMLLPRRLGHRQNPSPQDFVQFSDGLLPARRRVRQRPGTAAQEPPRHGCGNQGHRPANHIR